MVTSTDTMRILLIHNHYGGISGESTVMEVHKSMFSSHGHQVRCYTRSSVELEAMKFGKARAFFSGFHNPASVREVKKVVEEFMPDVVHVHNLYPLVSPAILPHIRKFGVPVVMTVHNYRLLCPNGLFYNRTGICEECAGGKEWNCVRFNCEESLPKSIGYALRNAWARLARYYLDNVDAFLCLTEFQKQKLIDNGFARDRCFVLPNFIDEEGTEGTDGNGKNEGVVFIGRLNRQKGADLLIRAASEIPQINFNLIGAVDESVVNQADLPPNVACLGVVSEEVKREMIGNARILVFPSRSYEGFPMVFLESMQQGLPVIAPRLAGYPEVIGDNNAGWLFEPENVQDLVDIILQAYGDPSLAQHYGRNGKAVVRSLYSPEAWYINYMKVIEHCRSRAERSV